MAGVALLASVPLARAFDLGQRRESSPGSVLSPVGERVVGPDEMRRLRGGTS
jgi:hypothetical protein